MKKQFLFLAFFALAYMAGVVAAFAQPQNHLTTAPTTCPTVTAVTCLTSDALHPVPGTPYTYTVTVPTPATGTKHFRWFVTQDPAFITAGNITTAIEASDGTGNHIAAITAAGTSYNQTPTGGASTIEITWKSFTHNAANPVFLVIYVRNDDTCTNDNIQVYIIEPVHAFTLDLAHVGLDGVLHADATWDGPCAAPVASATYDPGTQRVLMNYGVNYMYFAVTAANYTGAWRPSFQVSGDGITGTPGDRSVTAVDWTYPATSNSTVATDWHAAPLSGADFVSTDAVKAQAASKTVGSGGECIIVRVTIDNGRVETLSPAAITFAVDGVVMTESTPNSGTYDTAGSGDIHHADCTVDGFTNDHLTQNIMPRPDIQSTTPGVAPNPNPGTFIPKN